MSMCVVVPTFNNVRGLRYVYNIQSILNQNYTNYLVVILDDGSSDKTGILIERYLRRRKIGSDKVFVVKKG
jgi:glycosyltransferase involved in cell wall biosynthesis